MNKKVLIIYNTEDETWKTQLDMHLKGLINAGLPLETDDWNNTRFTDDDASYRELETALQQAAATILITSDHLLESNLFQKEKIRNRLKIKLDNGFPIFLLLIRRCGWKRFPWMRDLPVFPDAERFLADLNPTAVDNTLTTLTERIGNALDFAPQITQGRLSLLELRGIGPVKTSLTFQPNSRLNILTGDNGFGKTFLLECAWKVLTGKWTKHSIYPRDDVNRDEVCMNYRFIATSGAEGGKQRFTYDWETQKWKQGNHNSDTSGLVLYAGADGTFALWDPVRSRLQPPAGYSTPYSPIFFSDASAVYNGVKEFAEGRGVRQLCNGLIDDWVHWQSSVPARFKVFKNILEKLSTFSQEPLIPTTPGTIYGDTRPMPMLKYPYGNIPFIHCASSVQRIVSLAYLMVWLWEEHKNACNQSRKPLYGNMTVLIDELECHLHPQWQRSILPALLKVNESLDPRLKIQFIVTTHSPLVPASLEPIIDSETDGLHHFDIEGDRVYLQPLEFRRRGRVDNWMTSRSFGLEQARSIEAQQAIADARELQRQKEPDSRKVREVHLRLAGLLSEFDSFWPRWVYFAKQHEVEEDDPGSTETRT